MRQVLALVLLIVAVARVDAQAPAQPTPFSSAVELAPAWRHTTLPKVERPTRFALVEREGRRVLEARAEASASSLTQALDVDPTATPILRWRWRTEAAVPGSDLRLRERDDYAARLYVFFDYDPSRLPLGERIAFALGRAIHGEALPAAALCYVWGTAQAVGTIAPNPYTDRLRMVVVESGNDRAGDWLDEARDVAADFQAAFGEPAPRITGIAVGADTDNTGATATTWFGDITFGTRP
ncbi:MAG: DUF3047 domain-containing protein [Rhodocyclaceae bacterium]|nr:DUF3047 domain-containing protein [Rhodocyclaceae bacterium]